MSRTCRVGVHGRNDVDFYEADYRLILEANIETLKMMSHTRPDHFRRLKEVKPDLELITRLYDDRFGPHSHPTPEQFAQRMLPIMQQLQPYTTKFEIHNEPNHLDRIEGWGQTDEDAHSFNAWFLRTYDILKAYCPWAQLGFPGLAIPHRDLEWIEICRQAATKADWLGVHCYWQTPAHEMRNHLSEFWGLRFKYYHQRFPNKIIDLTEVGNSNVQNNIPFSEASHAREFTEYLTECFKYPYLNSASFFIMSSPDRSWDGFCWRSEDGRRHQMVWAVRDMLRPHLGLRQSQVTTAAPGGATPDIQNIINQLPRNPAFQIPARPIAQIDRILIHHSAVAPTVGANRIAAYLVQNQGQAGIKYHYFITAEGIIQQTNVLTAQTTQSTEQLNPVAIGIGFAGNFTTEAPTPAQIEAGAQLIAWLVRQLNLSPQMVFGHKEVVSTQSPGLQWDAGAMWGQQLHQRIQVYLNLT